MSSITLPMLALLVAALPRCGVREAAAPDPRHVLDASLAPSNESPILPTGDVIAEVSERVTPSVVSVLSDRGEPMARRLEHSLGSGVIVSADGIIMTNNHVVEHADKIRIAINDGRELVAKVVGTDPQTDIAVLRVEARDLRPIEIADTSRLRVGNIVLAVGNPFGVGQTVTMGIISALGRSNLGITAYEDFIQTDAAINPGNSGGALVNMKGELVGINTAIASKSGGYQGIGFAIPSNMALAVEGAILKHGKVTRGWLGVAIQELTPDLAKALDLKPRAGVLVSEVARGGPADKAGMKAGDVITAVDGVHVEDPGHLRNLVAEKGKSKQVRVDLLRDGHARTVQVNLGELPQEPGAARSEKAEGAFAGVIVQDLDAQLRKRLRVPAELKGVVVVAIDPHSPASDLGLQPGDVILEIDRVRTPDVQAFRNEARRRGEHALALVYREGRTLFLALGQ